MSDLVERLCDYDRRTAARDMVEAAARIKVLEAALRKHGHHTSNCRYHGGHDCNCGLDEIRTALAPEQEK